MRAFLAKLKCLTSITRFEFIPNITCVGVFLKISEIFLECFICPAAADADAAAGLGEGNDGYEDFSSGGMRCNQDGRNGSWEESKCNAKRTFVGTNKTINAGENSVDFKSHHAAIVQEPADGFSETKELLSFVENIQ